ncbi:MAG: hypothetical protein FJW94_10830 [Actinobacteria bacterium]|nr:hypothetical protein [Actinomycetota bacterium]
MLLRPGSVLRLGLQRRSVSQRRGVLVVPGRGVLGPAAVNFAGATQITAGSSHTCVLVAGGQARCWGNNGFGQLGRPVKFQTPVAVVTSRRARGSVSVSRG